MACFNVLEFWDIYWAGGKKHPSAYRVKAYMYLSRLVLFATFYWFLDLPSKPINDT